MTVVALTAAEQGLARSKAVQAAYLAYRNKAVVHYTQSAARWQGIADRRIADQGRYPNYADCSSFATWCLWNGLFLPFGMEDVVNGAAWQAGYTGTMLGHGTAVAAGSMVAGDCVIYGTGFPGHHTAICVGSANGVPMVISHGSEAGPFYLPWNYRGDVMTCRRYIDSRPHEAHHAPALTPPSEDEIMAIAVGDLNGTPHVFVEDKDGRLWYTWQKKGSTSWEGGKSGKQVAGLQPFAPAPK